MFAFEGLLKLVVWDRVWLLLLDATIKATLLLTVATIVSFALRKSSAAARHRLWALTMLSLIVLPLLPSVIPVAWSVTVPQQVASLMAPRLASEPRVAMPPTAFVPVPVESFDVPTNGSSNSLPQELERFPNEISAAPASRFPKSDAAISWTDAVIIGSLVWLCGAAMCLASIAIGTWRVVRFRAASSVLDDRDWNVIVDETKRRLGLTRAVPLREHPEPVVPMILGVLRPVVVLPRQAREWPEQLKRIVLLHELAHVKRRDVAFQWLGRLACALYWFHPLAWFGLRQLRRERELACDDLVVHCGERATEYAEALVSVAKNYQTQRGLTCAVAMARHGNLEGRMRSLFDKDIVRSHKPLSRIVAIAMLAGSALAVSAVSAMQLAAEPPEIVEAPVVFTPDEEPEDQEPEQLKPSRWPLLDSIADGIDSVVGEVFGDALGEAFDENHQYRVAGPLERNVKVIDEAGNPVEGAKIIPWGFGTSNGTGWGWIEIWPKEFVTNAEGIATVFVAEELTAFLPAASGNFTHISFRVEHPDFAPEVQGALRGDGKQPVTLSKGVTVVVKAVDSASNRQVTSDLYAVSSGYPSPKWKLETGLLRSMPFNATAPDTGRYFRVIYAQNDAQGTNMTFSDVIDASLLEIKDHIANPEIELHPGVELSGALSANVERPVKAGGRIIAMILSGSDHTGCVWQDVAPIAEDGTFRFAALPRNSHVELIAVCDGWVSRCTAETAVDYDQKHGTEFAQLNSGGMVASTPFRLESDAANVIVNMVETGICKFKVVDEHGDPIDLATIMLMPNHVTRRGSTFLGTAGRSIDALQKPDSEPNGLDVGMAKFYIRVTNPQGIAVISNLPATSQTVMVDFPGYSVVPDPRYATMGGFSMEVADIKEGELNQKILKMRKIDEESGLVNWNLLPADTTHKVMLRIVDADGVPLPKAKITLVSQNITTLDEKQPWPADWPHDVSPLPVGAVMIRLPRSAIVTAVNRAQARIWIDIEADGCVPLKNHEVSLSQRLPIRLQALDEKPE